MFLLCFFRLLCITHSCSFAGKELADLGAAGAQLHTQIFKIMVAVGSLAVLPALAKVTIIYTIVLQTLLLLLDKLAAAFVGNIVSHRHCVTGHVGAT